MEEMKMIENILIAKLSSLLERENLLVSELILQTVIDVESRTLSIETHAKSVERQLDLRLSQLEGERNDDY